MECYDRVAKVKSSRRVSATAESHAIDANLDGVAVWVSHARFKNAGRPGHHHDWSNSVAPKRKALKVVQDDLASLKVVQLGQANLAGAEKKKRIS